MVNYWLCVTSGENWNVIRKRKTWGVSGRHRRQIAKVKEGDFLVFYVKGQGLAGIFKVVSEPFEDEEKLFKKGLFPNRVRLESLVLPEKMIQFKELAKKLKFVSVERWRVHLQVTMRTITKEDYEIMKAALSAAQL